ncbi:hypothetical protein J2Y69_003595 [Microbacterium resistens]|uniref:Uncharacterized protein n=1 Tax=Microbacterium resistens TaxID=156977 RepID=A0ABU1SHE0_9MICO|nr:hypothetical protein [Microbacterium resistens]
MNSDTGTVLFPLNASLNQFPYSTDTYRLIFLSIHGTHNEIGNFGVTILAYLYGHLLFY